MSTSKPLALVTGASRGIGAACARRLACEGYHVWVHYHQNEAAARNVLAQIEHNGGSGEVIGFDVSNGVQTEEVLIPLLEARGPLAALVVNAGIRADAPLALMLSSEWRQVLGVNLEGFFNVAKPVVKGMLLARAGRIVAVTSVSGQSGMPGQVNYAASKAGLIGAVKALAREVARRKVTVNAVSPGFIETDMLGGLDPAQLTGVVPLGRLGQPEEVAAAVAFLLSDKAAYITGQVLGINGGIYL
ncbi:MAG: 3-oxoacyl-ACP reductase FabG [Candidatus Firestonebacteria bacterium]|nr:3-oxoacyl-ACP reductase FabG [Candidatus Firestonebacteria bacterium]